MQMKLHIAAVHANGGIRAIAAGWTEDQAVRRVAGYVRQNADQLLWPPESHQVHMLLDRGRLQEAIDFYFARVGGRWDREFLHTAVVRLDAQGPEPDAGSSDVMGNGSAGRDAGAVR